MKREVTIKAFRNSKFEVRYVLINKHTGKVIDNANGYGYKSQKNAYAAWYYKTQTSTTYSQKAKLAYNVYYWQEKYQIFDKIDELCLETLKGSLGTDSIVNCETISKLLPKGCPYSPDEVLCAWAMMESLLRRSEREDMPDY